MVLPPTPQRHELAKTIHATFLYPTARLPPLFDAVVVITGGWCVAKKKVYKEDTTSGAPRNHTNVPPVDAHV